MTKTRRAGFRKKRRRGGRKTVKRRGGRRRSRVTKRGGRRRSRGTKRGGFLRQQKCWKKSGLGGSWVKEPCRSHGISIAGQNIKF